MKLRNALSNPLTTFIVFEVLIAIVCIFIPLLLWLADTGGHGAIRSSISDYVYMKKSYIFGMLLCMGAMLFIFNGAVYFRNESKFQLNKHGKWYNVVLGISLLGVILFPHLDYPVTHYIFAITFFAGNALVTAIFSYGKLRIISIIFAVLILAVFLPYIFNDFLLIWSEWWSLFLIAYHFILQAVGVFSLQKSRSSK